LSEAARLRQARASPAFTPRAVFHEPASSGPPTLSLHDALPISHPISLDVGSVGVGGGEDAADDQGGFEAEDVALVSVAQEWKTRSEEHTSELQSLRHLVCRLLLEKKKPIFTLCAIASSSCLAIW